MIETTKGWMLITVYFCLFAVTCTTLGLLVPFVFEKPWLVGTLTLVTGLSVARADRIGRILRIELWTRLLGFYLGFWVLLMGLAAGMFLELVLTKP